ncbi:DGQHR domain-containing protein [Maribellus sediminis]|uniref:DGQHR domain-containing protein n=1 Tax=Maribellus sediminis TaxID=2696285 RepID=UPI0014320381|nr:DGQHR domain-containing protein [Maribellus sediminis]
MNNLNTAKLKTSWTRYSIVHAVELIADGDLSQVIAGQVDQPVIKALLGTTDLDNIPEYWLEVVKHRETRSYFALMAALLTHIDIVDDFKQFYMKKNFKGVFLYNKPGSLNRKVQTNIRSVLIAGKAAKSNQRLSKVVEYDISPLYADGDLGALFRNVLEDRLKLIGISDDEINSNLFEKCQEVGFDKVLGLNKSQFNEWIGGQPILNFNTDQDEDFIIPNPPLKGLDHISEISARRINSKYSEFITKVDKKIRKEEYLNEGWTLAKSLKSSNKYQKKKPHNEAFEDKVWAVFAKAGFTWLNSDRNFKITHSKSSLVPPKQIDVIAIDEDTAVIIECKSAQSRKSKSFQKDIAEIGQMMSGIQKTLNESLEKQIRIAWIFATNNYVVSDNDKARMQDIGIFHMNQDEIDYWWEIAKNLDHATKYQMFGKLYEQEKIPGDPTNIPAIKGTMGGHTYYSFSVKPETLLNIGFVLHRTDTSAEAFESYQRMIKGSRVRDISKYVSEKQGFFPNSVIINFKTLDNNGNSKGLNFSPLSSSMEHDGYTELGILTLPNYYRSAFIVDGQHRIFGYGGIKNRYTDELPVVAFEDLPAEDQTKIFIDINNTQKSVPRNLLRTMMSEFNWGSASQDEAFDALKTRLIHKLGTDDNSPLYKRIILSEESKNTLRCLTLEQLLSWGINPTLFLGLIQKRKLTKTGYFWTGDFEETLEKCFKFIVLSLNVLESECSEQWDKGSGEGGFIAMNVGISSFLRLLDDLLKHEVNDGFEVHKENAEGIFKQIKPYIDSVAIFLNSLNPSELKKLRGYYGTGAVKKILPEFQHAVHKDHEDYDPPGLQQWIKDTSGQFNNPTKLLGDQIQLGMREYIFAELKKHYGLKNWWIEGVHKDIRKYCSNTAIDQGNKEPDENYLLTIHYQKIIMDNTELFLNVFTPPGLESVKIAKRIEWINRLNTVRQKFSHPEREKVTEAEYKMIAEIGEWLLPKLNVE